MKSDVNLTPLLVGKTSTDFYDTINEMKVRPKYITKSLEYAVNVEENEIYDYIISVIK